MSEKSDNDDEPSSGIVAVDPKTGAPIADPETGEPFTFDEDAVGELVAEVTAQRVSMTSGPLPPASMLREYNEVEPGLSSKIINSWLGETEQRHMLERIATSASAEAARAAPRFMFGLGSLCVVGATIVMILHGGSWPAAFLDFGGIACITTGGVLSRLVTARTSDIATVALDSVAEALKKSKPDD